MPIGPTILAALGGIACGALVAWFLRRRPYSQLAGASLGLLVGLATALLLLLALQQIFGAAWNVQQAAQTFLLAVCAASGLAVGARRTLEGAKLSPSSVPPASVIGPDQRRLLDTSVIIDGRVADIAETGFLQGTLVVPQFVVAELQQIADSPDALKRNRGRRGLDLLQRMQKSTKVRLEIVDEQLEEIREVDDKLVELGRRWRCPILTNDFNLNKVAQLRGVAVLNINELANTVKPAALPGEIMHVLIQREGKEPGQGVAYLDDGTMVVVDGARRFQNKRIEVAVTSVLQTTAGKMIFAKFDERMHSVLEAKGAAGSLPG